MPIQVLDGATVGRIAAGEVVERPASIVKELVENALDAGASAITVEIKDGGISLIRVTDNGRGIPAQEARIAFENHATSKIKSGDELTDIATLGFRGEALPSIAAVARVTMTTRTRGAEAGVQVSIEGGVFQGVQAAGCPEGTTMMVRDLFFNLPVRRTFLKKPATEAGVVADMMAKLTLGNPDRSIRFLSGGKEVYHSFGDGNMRHAAMSVYGRETAEKLISVDEAEGGFRLSGLIGVEELGRASRAQQSIFINGRVVRCSLITQALEQAARGRVMIGQYPMCSLALTMAPGSVDVNVHPNKLEVRFRDEAALRGLMEAMFARVFQPSGSMLEAGRRGSASETPLPVTRVAFAERLSEPESASKTEPSSGEKTPPEAVSPPAPASLEQSAQCAEAKDVEAQRQNSAPDAPEEEKKPEQPEDFAPIRQVWPPAAQNVVVREGGYWRKTEVKVPDTEEQTESEQQSVLEDEKQTKASYKILGVCLHTYILLEMGEALLIIDQHAAHERILYQQYEKALLQGVAMQKLLTPIVTPISQRDRALLLDNQELLLEAGYEIEPFGDRDIQVRGVPYILGQAELRPLFAELVECLDQLKSAAVDRRRAEVIQSSCKHAVKAGDVLTDLEIHALIDEMATTGAPPTCPHGRPVVKTFSKYELEKLFRRA